MRLMAGFLMVALLLAAASARRSESDGGGAVLGLDPGSGTTTDDSDVADSSNATVQPEPTPSSTTAVESEPGPSATTSEQPDPTTTTTTTTLEPDPIKRACSGTVWRGIASASDESFLVAVVHMVLNHPFVCMPLLTMGSTGLPPERDPAWCLQPFVELYVNSTATAENVTALRTCLREVHVEFGVGAQEDPSEAYSLLVSHYGLRRRDIMAPLREFHRFCRSGVAAYAAGTMGEEVLPTAECTHMIKDYAWCETQGITKLAPTIDLSLPDDGQTWSLAQLYNHSFSVQEVDDPDDNLTVHLPEDTGMGSGQDGVVQRYQHVLEEDLRSNYREVLVVAVKRFVTNSSVDSSVTRKLHQPVDVPLTWLHPRSNRLLQISYKLSGFVVHHGDSAEGGDYSTYIGERVGKEVHWLRIHGGDVEGVGEEEAHAAASFALMLQYRNTEYSKSSFRLTGRLQPSPMACAKDGDGTWRTRHTLTQQERVDLEQRLTQPEEPVKPGQPRSERPRRSRAPRPHAPAAAWAILLLLAGGAL